MTSTLTVVLEEDLGEDRVQLVSDAINILRGVLHVTTKQIDQESAYASEMRVKYNVRAKLCCNL